jgi:hypothetical protein
MQQGERALAQCCDVVFVKYALCNCLVSYAF